MGVKLITLHEKYERFLDSFHCFRKLCSHYVTHLRNGRHVDNVSAPKSEHLTLCLGREPRSLDSDHRTSRVNDEVTVSCCSLIRAKIPPQLFAHHGRDHFPRPRAKWLFQRQVTDAWRRPNLAVEKGLNTLRRPVDELVEDDQITGAIFFAQRPTARGREDVSTPGFLQGPYVGTEVDVGWHYFVIPAMPAIARGKISGLGKPQLIVSLHFSGG